MKATRSVLLRMAADEDRAERIRELKERRPDLTWGRIASAIPVSERSTYDWRRTGAISHEHAIELARVFDVDPDWLWSGRDPDAPSPDLMGTLSRATQLDRIEAKLDQLQATVARAAIELELLVTAQRKNTQGRNSGAKTVRPRKAGSGS